MFELLSLKDGSHYRFVFWLTSSPGKCRTFPGKYKMSVPLSVWLPIKEIVLDMTYCYDIMHTGQNEGIIHVSQLVRVLDLLPYKAREQEGEKERSQNQKANIKTLF